MRKAKSPKTRRAVVFLLMDEKGGAPVAVLSQVLKEETDPEIRQQAVLALGQTKSDEAVAALLEIAKGKDAKLANAAVLALGEIGTPKAKAALLEILNKKDGDAAPEKEA